jgi:hypothetical protein
VITALVTAAALAIVAWGPSKDQPAMMVLEVQGPVEVTPVTGRPRRAAVGELLSPGERLAVPAGGAATVAVLGSGVKEEIKPGSEATVGSQGCTPPEAVLKRTVPRVTVARALKGLSLAPLGGRFAGVVFRGAEDQTAAAPPAVTPIFGAAVLDGRPTLSWTPIPGATEYRVRLFRVGGLLDDPGREHTLWMATTREPRLPYPEQETPLPAGVPVSWSVTAQTDAGAVPAVPRSKFAVLTTREAADLVGVKPLAEGRDPADLLLAALTYHAFGVYDEALPLFERLARLEPNDVYLQATRAEYYTRAGRLREAREALERAKALGYQPTPE